VALFRKRPSAPVQPEPAAPAAWVSQPPAAPTQWLAPTQSAPPATPDPAMPAMPATPASALSARREQAETIRRGGRPRTDNPRSKSLNVRFTEDEWARVLERAAPSGRPPRDLAREALLHGSMASAPKARARADAELTGQVARIGNNLNQVVRALNEAKAAGQLDVVTLKMAVDKIDALRAELAELTS